MILDIITICVSTAALVAAGFAIWQTQRFQDRAWLHVRWDRIGLTGGIEEHWFGAGSAAYAIPFMKISISNHGRDHARMVDVTTNTAVIGFTQETDDGVRPYQERSFLAPGESWDIQVPLFQLQETFDHPFTLLDATLQRPTLEVRWLEVYSRRMKRLRVTLDGPWLKLYGEMRDSILEGQASERRRGKVARTARDLAFKLRHH
ncbi:hypothetical protein [Amnibacterium endophyticum]|uniref:DUF4352 domain-containing protein n=1 Tax=Amnibacterium endophyticum TaxID=2109337 RepID=A0ABW4LLF3_9MICO